MADKPKDDKKVVKPEEKEGSVSRRDFIVGAGAGVAGLIVGGAVGYKVIPQPEEPVLAEPELWIGRRIADCTGCRECELACSQAKENGKFWPGAARVRVPQYYPGNEFPVLCYQCGENAKCVANCPVQALSVKPGFNNIVVDTTKCLRTAKNGDCTICQDKCSGSTVQFHPVNRAPLFCDLCNGDPACTKACPSGTLANKGIRMGVVAPDQIAKQLADMYKVASPAKTEVPSDPVAMAKKIFG